MVADYNDISPDTSRAPKARILIHVRDGQLIHTHKGKDEPCKLEVTEELVRVGCTDLSFEAVDYILTEIAKRDETPNPKPPSP